jgi:NUMOD3 motif-containing protein
LVKRVEKPNELILCACGCKQRFWKYDNLGRERHFIKGHNSRVRKHSEETKKKISESNKGLKRSEETRKKMLGENNHKWVGNKVSITALHKWVRSRFPKSKLCQLCNKVPPIQLACITGIYNRELRNWAWFCVKCHHKWDNIGAKSKLKRLRDHLLD